MKKTLLERVDALERRLMPPAESSKIATFGERLRRLRHDADLSQSELIIAVGISKGFLSDLENDKRCPGADVLCKLARRLGVSMDYLWTGK